VGWVTAIGQVNHLATTSHPGQLSLAIPSWVGAMSIGDGYGTAKPRFLRSGIAATKTAGILNQMVKGASC